MHLAVTDQSGNYEGHVLRVHMRYVAHHYHHAGLLLTIILQQPNEPKLYPTRLHNMDGNFSAKRIDGSGSADPRVFHSDYFIRKEKVEQFKNDVHDKSGNQPGNRAQTCSDNWTAAKAVEEGQIKVFEQTGIFVLACRHGFVESIAEMRHSGEL